MQSNFEFDGTPEKTIGFAIQSDRERMTSFRISYRSGIGICCLGLCDCDGQTKRFVDMATLWLLDCATSDMKLFRPDVSRIIEIGNRCFCVAQDGSFDRTAFVEAVSRECEIARRILNRVTSTMNMDSSFIIPENPRF